MNQFLAAVEDDDEELTDEDFAEDDDGYTYQHPEYPKTLEMENRGWAR